jgi:hypothetical protein
VNTVAVDIQFQPKRGLDGLLTIRATCTADITIDDELWHQVMHLARAAGELANGHPAAIPYSAMPGAYELTPEGDDVVVSGDYIQTTRLPRQELVAAAFAVADRWVSHARASGDPEQETLASDVETAVAEARQTAR